VILARRCPSLWQRPAPYRRSSATATHHEAASGDLDALGPGRARHLPRRHHGGGPGRWPRRLSSPTSVTTGSPWSPRSTTGTTSIGPSPTAATPSPRPAPPRRHASGRQGRRPLLLDLIALVSTTRPTTVLSQSGWWSWTPLRVALIVVHCPAWLEHGRTVADLTIVGCPPCLPSSSSAPGASGRHRRPPRRGPRGRRSPLVDPL